MVWKLSRRAILVIIGLLALEVLLLAGAQYLNLNTLAHAALVILALVPLTVGVSATNNCNARLALAGIALTLGAGALTTYLAFDVDRGSAPVLLVSSVYIIFGLVEGFRWGQSFTEADASLSNEARNLKQFHTHLVILGATLLIVGMVSTILLGGLVATHHFDLVEIDSPIDGDIDEYYRNLARLLLLSAGHAILGGLFFVANACRNKKKRLEETSTAFSVSRFWGGLWFRLGEALVFTLVLFNLVWALQASSEPSGGEASRPIEQFAWLPLLSLIIGMFVKAGETLVRGISERVFEIVAVVVRPSDPTTKTTIVGREARFPEEPEEIATIVEPDMETEPAPKPAKKKSGKKGKKKGKGKKA